MSILLFTNTCFVLFIADTQRLKPDVCQSVISLFAVSLQTDLWP